MNAQALADKAIMQSIALVVIQWASSTVDDTKALDKVLEVLTAKQVTATRRHIIRYRKPAKH